MSQEEKYLNRIIGQLLNTAEMATNTVYAINDKGKPATYTVSILLLFSDYQLSINNPIIIVPDDKNLNDLIGCKVVSTNELPEEAMIVFDNGYTLTVNMRDYAYYDPESMSLQGPDNFLVVWN